MLANRTVKKQAGWRVDPIVIGRVKEAARQRQISANVFVETILLEATQGIETEEERMERLKRNDSILSRFAGKWLGDETAEQILAASKNNSESKDIIAL